MAILGAIGSFLGAKTGLGAVVRSVGGALLGNALDRRRDSQALRDKYSYLEGKGLTPQEIAGSGFGASPSGGAANVLGNQSAQLESQRRQLEFQQSERDKDRAVQLRGQDMGLAQSRVSAGAILGSAQLSASTAADRLSLDRERFDNVEMPAALRQSVTEAPEWKRMQILASMGVDNILGTAVAQMYGVNPMDPSAVKAMSARDFGRMAQTIYGMQSNAFGEASGAALAVRGAFGNYGDAATLGSRGRRN